MDIANAPSKLSWYISRIKREIQSTIDPSFQARIREQQIKEIYECAKKASNYNFGVNILDSGWATQRCFTDKHYLKITQELLEIDKAHGTLIMKKIPPALHWSRRYEYPYALINSLPSGHKSKGFKILDCGGGFGPLQYYLAMKGFEVYNLDLDLSALERVTKYKSKEGLKHLHPTFGNILDMPFPKDYFDSVICISVLEHILSDIEQNIGK